MAAEEDEALSDFEDDAAAPVVLPVVASTTEERLRRALAELSAEAHARQAAEAARFELQCAFDRLKSQSLETLRHRDEALLLKEELTKQLNDALQLKESIRKERDEILKEKDDALRRKEDSVKACEALRAEISTAAGLLVSGVDKIKARASSVKSFPGGLPRHPSYTGITALAHGFTKRAEEIVDEVVGQYEAASKGRAEMRDRMEQRNYQIAIDVSQLEASIQELREEVAVKASEVEKGKKLLDSKEAMLVAIEHEMEEKMGEATSKAEHFCSIAEVAEAKVQALELKMKRMDTLVGENAHSLHKAREILLTHSDSFSFEPQIQLSSKLVTTTTLVQESLDPEEGLRECVSIAKELAELSLKVGLTWGELEELRKREKKSLEEEVSRLVQEKKKVASYLRSALVDKQEMMKVVSESQAKKGSDALPPLGLPSESESTTSEESSVGESDESPNDDVKAEEAIDMASALENEVKSFRQDIFELQRTLAVSRAEVTYLKASTDNQSIELAEKISTIEGLQQKNMFASKQIEGLTRDLTEAEEEISRWKHAAKEEAAAGASILEDFERCQDEMKSLKQQAAQLSQLLDDANSKLRSKEEMASAAIAARNAAERSLRLADERAAELRERIEEMNRQLEELEGRGEFGGVGEMCWPWHLLRGQWRSLSLFTQDVLNPSERQGHSAAEMEELLQPLV